MAGTDPIHQFVISDLIPIHIGDQAAGTAMNFSFTNSALFMVATVVILIHSYYGFFATGGPEGVGIASGRAVRASSVAIVAIDMLLTIALWGFNATISFTG